MKKDGGPAFPNAIDNFGGLSLRDYFAAVALQGLLVKVSYSVRVGEHVGPQIVDSQLRESIAKASYDMADAMLAERQKP